MQISISSIRDQQGASLPFEFTLPGADLQQLPGGIRSVSDVYVEGSITNTGESMLVKARAEGRFQMECSRCLQPVQTNFVASIQERFRRGDPTLHEQPDADAPPEEDDVSYYEGERIELGETVRETIALQLPMKPVCRPDCRGLCSSCGTNLNEQTCDCRDDAVDPRLEVLREWKAKRTDDSSSD